jgi:hypothetical protein
MNPSRSALPKPQRVDHSLCGLRILSFKPVHCGAGCRKHANSAQSGPRPPLKVIIYIYVKCSILYNLYIYIYIYKKGNINAIGVLERDRETEPGSLLKFLW